MEKVLVMLLTALIFFLGFLILTPSSRLNGDRYTAEEKVTLTRTFARTLESDPKAPRWSRVHALPSPQSPAPEAPEHPQKQLPTRPWGLAAEAPSVTKPTNDPEGLLQSIEMTYQKERNPETLREVETLALETLHQILRQPESPLRMKAMKLLEIDLLPNASSPDRRVEIETLLNDARLATPQAPQVDR